MLMTMLRSVLPLEIYGGLRYRKSPGSGRAWGGPFNGQRGRCLLVAEVIQHATPEAIVETGTYLGTTTEWLTAFQIPVYTVESEPESFGFSRARLAGLGNATVLQGDSRAKVHELLTGPLQRLRDACVFFYLDAHWGDDLPLAEELDIVFTALPKAVVMIDDFEVPGDAGYGYDDYGSGKGLIRSYIEPTVSRHDLIVCYPALPSESETGAKRGNVVLAKRAEHAPTFSAIKQLRIAQN